MPFAAIFVAAGIAGASPVSLYISENGSDDLGRRIVFELQDAVRLSGSLALANTEADAGYRVRVATIAIAETDTNISAYSFTITKALPISRLGTQWYGTNAYIGSNLGYCGTAMAKQCASLIFEQIGAAITADASSPPPEGARPK